MVERELARVAGAGEAGRLLRPEVPDTVVEEVAGEIAALVRRAELRCAFEVGRLVAERFFGGDPEAWHRPGPKEDALPRLALRLRERGVRGAASLHLCLGVYETLRAFGEIPARESLTRTHVRTVLALPLPARVSLLREAERRGWSVRELEAAVAREPRARRRGRRPQPRFRRGISKVEGLLAPDGLAFRDLEGAADLDATECDADYARLVWIAERVETLRLRLSPKRVAAERAARRGSDTGAPSEQAGSPGATNGRASPPRGYAPESAAR